MYVRHNPLHLHLQFFYVLLQSQSEHSNSLSACESYKGHFHLPPPTQPSYLPPMHPSPLLPMYPPPLTHHSPIQDLSPSECRKRSGTSNSNPDTVLYGHPHVAAKMPLSNSEQDGFILSVVAKTRPDSVVSHTPVQVSSRTPSPGSRRSSRVITPLSIENSVELVQKVTPL